MSSQVFSALALDHAVAVDDCFVAATANMNCP